MKRCFLDKIDQTFDKERDLALGPWCFENIEDIQGIDFIEPFDDVDILSEHKMCFEMAYYFLNKDMIAIEGRERDRFYLINQKKYLYLNYILYSRYRVIKKFVDCYGLEKISFQDVPQPRLDKEDSNQFVKIYYIMNGWIVASILKILYGDKVSWFVAEETNEAYEVPWPVPGKQTFKQSLNSKINLFRDVKGIKPLVGIFFSIIYVLTSIFRKKILPKVTFYGADSDSQSQRFFPTFSDFEQVFFFIRGKLIQEGTIPYKKVNAIRYLQWLSIGPPGTIMYDDNQHKDIINSYLEGSKVVVMQHGAGYGTYESHFRRELEFDYTSFQSYGDVYKSYAPRQNINTKLPNPYLSMLKDSYLFSNQCKVLWITCFHGRAGDGLEYLYGTQVPKYMKRKKALYRLISPNIKSNLIYKTLKESTLEFFDEMKKIIPSHQVIQDTPSIQLMSQAKVVIADYYGTPFYEAMSMNVPILCGFFECEALFTPQAQVMFDEFKAVSVIHETPEQLASFLNEMYDQNINTWWNRDEIQKVRQKFLHHYANNDPYIFPWLKAIIRGKL